MKFRLQKTHVFLHQRSRFPETMSRQSAGNHIFFLLLPGSKIGYNIIEILIGGIPTPLKNMKVKLDHHPNYWGK